MSNEGTTVACIGLGRMGAGIARNIQQVGSCVLDSYCASDVLFLYILCRGD